MKKIILFVAFVAATCSLSAQTMPAMPVDSAVRIGHLDNGLTYYIRHNEMPKQRCDFHIAQAVGAILEEDHQNGLAHFLEHMAFNGTEHFPGKGIINYFESVGVSFGGNINAYTSLDKTVYRLSDVPTIREGIIDSALLVMHDWACGLSLLGEEIDAERGVIREEWRTGATASRRMWKEGNRKMYPGSQYAKRDVIGDTAVINNFAYQALRDYYHKWYGPDNQAIIVVGDIDVDKIEAKIKALWKDVPARANRGERPLYSVDNNKEPIIAIVKDKEAQSTTARVIFKHDELPAQVKGTMQEYLIDAVDELVYKMVAERMNELTLKPNSPIQGGAAYYTNLVKRKDAFMGFVAAKDGQEKAAYQLLLEQLEKMRRYGFTQAELDRAQQEMLSEYESAYNERAARKNIRLAQVCINNFLDGSYMPGIEWEYETMKKMLPMLSLDMVNQRVQSYFTDENIIVSLQGCDKEGVTTPNEAEALAMLNARKDLAIEAPKVEAARESLVQKAPKPGKIKKVFRNDSIGTTEWLLSNGVKVVFMPTEYKQDEIRLRAFSEGGTSLVENVADLPSAELATSAVSFMGYGDMSMTDLQKALSGKQCSTDFSISEYGENVSGSTTVRDFETMLQLVYLGFTAPRRDEEAFNTLMQLLQQQLVNKATNHKAIWRDSITAMRCNYSPRMVLMNEETAKKVNLDVALKFYKERFKNPADFTWMFVGNINPNDPKVQDLICRWIGGMKTSSKREHFIDRGIRVVDGRKANIFTRDMQIKTASNYICYNSYDIPYTMANDVNMELIGRILSTRYLESIREREGGSYGVGCYGVMSKLPVPNAQLVMYFDTDPDKQTRLVAIIHEEVKTIIWDGPLATDLQKEKENMLKELEEDLEQNGWWMNTLYMYYRWGENYVRDYKKAIEEANGESVRALLKQLDESGNEFEVIMIPEYVLPF